MLIELSLPYRLSIVKRHVQTANSNVILRAQQFVVVLNKPTHLNLSVSFSLIQLTLSPCLINAKR